MRTNNKENRMATLQSNGINTNNFFSINMNVPVGANVQILVDGVPYTVNSSNATAAADAITNKIIDNGYVFNRKTDGRFIVAQTFRMLNGRSYNFARKIYEDGWDAYLRNHYCYMYQFDMMLDELHKLARMEKDNDPDFDRLSHFFTRDVVVSTCSHYIRQLRKYIRKQPTRKCKGKPYVKLQKYGNVYLTDLAAKVYVPLATALNSVIRTDNYTMLESALREFMKAMNKLPYDTPKCSQWKDAFKGKGAYVTLLNLIKFHGVKVVDAAGIELDTYNSVSYVENLLETYKGAYWRFHEMLKAEIKRNNFDLKKSIEYQNQN